MDFIVRRGRGLDPMTLAWLMNTLQLGPGLGNIHFVCKESSIFYSWLRDDLKFPESQVHHTITAGEDALTSGRNDVLCVYPGAYDEAAEVDWDKTWTHMVGMGGPNIGGDHTEYNCCMYTDTTEVVQVLDVAGEYCQFHNMVFENYGANAANLFAVKVNDYGVLFKNCGIKGNMVSAQNGVATSGSLHIAGGGMYPVFEKCQIGQDVWGVRTTANQGVIVFNSSARPNGGDFTDCRILSVGDDANCCMIKVATATSIGRGWRFDNCIFSHFDSNASGVTDLAKVIYSPSTAVQREIIQLHRCMAIGVDEWQTDDDNVVVADMPIVGVGGGLATNPTAPTGT